MSDLSDIANALSAIDTDLADAEKRATEHDQADSRRFLQAQAGIADLYDRQVQLRGFCENYFRVLHDQMIEGFRELGAKIEKRDPDEITPRVGVRRDS